MDIFLTSSHLSSIVEQHKYCFADEVSQFLVNYYYYNGSNP